MALITCPDCEKQISDAAATCIHCGRPVTAATPPPAASDMASDVHAGVQSSKLKQDLGSAIAFVGLPVAMVIGMATSASTGWMIAVGVCIVAMIVHYG